MSNAFKRERATYRSAIGRSQAGPFPLMIRSGHGTFKTIEETADFIYTTIWRDQQGDNGDDEEVDDPTPDPSTNLSPDLVGV